MPPIVIVIIFNTHPGKREISLDMHHDFIFASGNDKLTDIVARMHRPHAAVGVILGREGRAASVDAVLGIITWEHIAEVLEESVDLFTEYRIKP